MWVTSEWRSMRVCTCRGGSLPYEAMCIFLNMHFQIDACAYGRVGVSLHMCKFGWHMCIPHTRVRVACSMCVCVLCDRVMAHVGSLQVTHIPFTKVRQWTSALRMILNKYDEDGSAPIRPQNALSGVLFEPGALCREQRTWS